MFGIAWGANQFVSLLIGYRQDAGVSVGTSQALVGVYALGLIPALLVGGPVSDRRGRGTVLRPAALLSVVATVVLMLGSRHVSLLYLGRLLAGVASGAVFAAGTAWVKELSAEPFEPAADGAAGARRAAVVLSAGFGLGPVVAGVIAQWAPHPLVLPYVAHLVIMAMVLPGLLHAPETVTRARPRPASRVPRGLSRGRFRGVVAPLAPWTFLSVSTAFAVLPGLVTRNTHGYAIAFSALAAGIALTTGVAVQPIARRLDRVDDIRGATVGLLAAVVGLLVAAAAAEHRSPLLVAVAALPLGASYGFCLVSGLLETQRLADPGELAGLTAVFYALTYVGFAGPLVLASLNAVAGYPTLLLGAAALAVLTLAVVHLRARATAAQPAAAATS